MERHGPLVLGTCRRLLRNEHDIEDAFQATFLVLVRKARHIRVGDSLGPWIHAVAYRVAVRVREKAATGRGRDLEGVEPVTQPSPSPGELNDLSSLLHEEIGKLPEKYRAPIVLCHLEGRSHEEAARVLRCPVGTLSGRLSRAREVLRSRLGRRGVKLPAGALMALLRAEASTAFRHSAGRFVMGAAEGTTPGGRTAAAETVAREVVRALSLHRWARILASLALIAGTAAMATLWSAKRPPLPPMPELQDRSMAQDTGVAGQTTSKKSDMPPILTFEEQLVLAQIAADVAVLESRQRVLGEELTKVGAEFERSESPPWKCPGRRSRLTHRKCSQLYGAESSTS